MLSLLILLFSISDAWAQQSLLRGIKGKDDRVLIEHYKYPWSAIGRLNKETGGFCTGTLIAPKLVLTAAHCLWNKKRKVWLKAHTIHFLPGYRRGSYIAHSRAKKYHIAPGYNPKQTNQLSIAAKDWAIVELKDDISAQVGTMAIIPPTAKISKSALIQAGYSQDKAHILSVNKNCPMESLNPDLNIAYHRCDAVHGDSGSPIFYLSGNKPVIAYIHVATTRKERAQGVAVSTTAIREHLKSLKLWKQSMGANAPTQSAARPK